MTATVPAQTSPQNPARGIPHVKVLAGHLRVGDYLPFARRTVLAIEPVGGVLIVSTVCPAGPGAIWRHRWRAATPVIIAPREL